MTQEIYLKNKKGEECVLVKYQTKTGILLVIEVYCELTDDWIEISGEDPMSASNKSLISFCQRKVDEAIDETNQEDEEAHWFKNNKPKMVIGII
jgi:hypothetical protein